MTTLVTRKGKTSLHQLRKLWREQDAAACAEVYERDPAEIAREDEDITARRAAYPLH